MSSDFHTRTCPGDEMLYAHSPTEARLYLELLPCAKCGGMRTHSPIPPRTLQHGVMVLISEPCPKCREIQQIEFALVGAGANAKQGDAINPGDEPSFILDAGQWLTLAQLLSGRAKSLADRVEGRRLSLRAGECLSEALKFFDDPDNDLPPDSAIWTDSSHRRFREAPQQFSRERILGELRKLPTALD